MDKLLRGLYDRFYEKPELTALNESIEANHRLLRERLESPEKKLVLRIIDDGNAIASALSQDGFLCGFRLAWQLSNEISNLENERFDLAQDAERSAHFLPDEGGTQ